MQQVKQDGEKIRGSDDKLNEETNKVESKKKENKQYIKKSNRFTQALSLPKLCNTRLIYYYVTAYYFF